MLLIHKADYGGMGKKKLNRKIGVGRLGDLQEQVVLVSQQKLGTVFAKTLSIFSAEVKVVKKWKSYLQTKMRGKNCTADNVINNSG